MKTKNDNYSPTRGGSYHFSLLIAFILLGALLWLVNAYFAMDGKIKRILNILVVIIVAQWLSSEFGVLGRAEHVCVPAAG